MRLLLLLFVRPVVVWAAVASALCRVIASVTVRLFVIVVFTTTTLPSSL